MALKAGSSLVSRSVAVLVVAGIIGAAAYSNTHQQHVTAANGAFSFAAVGDNGDDSGPDDQTNASSKTLQAAGGKSIQFIQTLGDLAYDPTATVTSGGGWCSWANGHTASTNRGTSVPLMLAAGNHEAQDAVSNFAIEDYTGAAACANPLASQTTYYASSADYAKDYYYDYPATNPNLRVININPGMTYQTGGARSYAQNGALYNWLSSAIDSAKTNNQWTVVTFHVPYLNAGSGHGGDMDGAIYGPFKQQFTDVYNLLVSKKVDLILNGHEHNYQRSKQLSLGAGCTAIASDTYNASCASSAAGTVADPYTKGSGPVQLVIGTGGHKPSAVSNGDGDYNYMLKAASGSGDCGLVKFDVTTNTLTGTFVNACGGSLSDTFTIAAPGDTSAPAVSISSPSNGATLSAVANATVQAVDTVGVTKVELYLNNNAGGNLIGTINGAGPYAFASQISTIANGTYSLVAKAYDAAGNIGTSSPVTVTVQNATPANPPSNGKTSFTVPSSDGAATTVSLSGNCSTVSASSAATAPSSLNSAQLLAGFGFTSTCAAAGSSATVSVDLGAKYDTTKLTVYKDQADGSLKNITSTSTFTDQTVSGAVHTFVTYSITDGAKDDTDGSADGKIVDPVYILNTAATAGGSGATGGTGGLAETGMSILPLALLGLGAVAVSRLMTLSRKRQ